MRDIVIRDFETERLLIKKTTIVDPFRIWNIVKDDKNTNYKRLKDDNQKFTWNIFLKNGELIGQIKVLPNDEFIDNPEIKDIECIIIPKYQECGFGTEAASRVLEFMFNEVEIRKVIANPEVKNEDDWMVMEDLGFVRTGEKESSNMDENGNSYCYKCNKKLFLNRPIK